MPADTARVDELDQSILSLCTRINAATYELMVLIREFDERCGWLQWGLDNCAEWLAWRCDLSMTTAREKVRVAHALKQLPLMSGAFASGELSYAKVRAMTRVATRDNEADLLIFALRHTAVTVEERCRELRCGRASSIGTAERAWASRSLRIRRDVERDLMTITVDLPMDSGELLEKALDRARDDEVLEVPDLVDTSWSVRQADVFVNVLQGYLSGKSGNCSDNYLVTIHVDESALAGGDGRAAVPIEAVKRRCCDGRAVVVTETAIDNLLLLCTKHHTLVHEGGFRIDRDFMNNWAFFRPDGIAVPAVGYVSELDDNPPAGGLLSMVENLVREPAPPLYLH